MEFITVATLNCFENSINVSICIQYIISPGHILISDLVANLFMHSLSAMIELYSTTPFIIMKMRIYSYTHNYAEVTVQNWLI